MLFGVANGMDRKAKRKVIRRSKTEIDELVERWNTSGDSMSGFARSEGVASTTLHPWIAAREFDTSSRRKDSNQTTTSGFSRVELVGQAV